MLLDFIDQGDEQTECNQIIRLYDFKTPEVELLRTQCIDLSIGAYSFVAVHELSFVTALDKCKLFLRVSGADFGIRQRSASRSLIVT